MKSIRLSTVLVVLTVALAGCAGGGVGGDAPASGDDTPTAVSTGGDDSSNSLSVAEVDERLREAGSFTTRWDYTITQADGTTLRFNQSYRVDLEANRSVERYSTTDADGATSFEVFVDDDTSYTRYGSGENVFYQISDQPQPVFDDATNRASTFDTYLEDDARFVGTESFDGDTVSRYEYTDADAWRTYNQGLASATFDTEEEVTITDFSITVLVDENNIGRLTTWTLTGETESGETVTAEWSYSLTEIGSTSVDDPDWLDEARAQQS